MIKEIERKFLVDETKLPPNLVWVLVQQGYLSLKPQVRIRLWGGEGEITIKSQGTLSRDEWGYRIPAPEAEELLRLCDQRLIKKERTLIKTRGKEWVVDRFLDPQAGLITAEIELETEEESIELPPWVTKEVTNDEKYLNVNLIRPLGST